MRGQVATLETNAAEATKDVAALQKAAAEAMGAQQLLQIELAKQQQRAAKAEKDLLDVQSKIKGRGISDLQLNGFRQAAAGKARGTVEITATESAEALEYAEDLRKMLVSDGWSVPRVRRSLLVGTGAIGLTLSLSSVVPVERSVSGTVTVPRNSGVFHGAVLGNALHFAGIPVITEVSDKTRVDAVELRVGTKP